MKSEVVSSVTIDHMHGRPQKFFQGGGNVNMC